MKLSVPENVLASPKSVDDAAPERDVKKPASLLNQLSLTDDEAIGCTKPFDPVYKNPCDRDERLRDEPMVDDAFVEIPWKYCVEVVADETAYGCVNAS